MEIANSQLPPELLAPIETLAQNLLASEPISQYHAAEAALAASAEAKTLLDRFAAAQADLRQRQHSGSLTQAEIDEVRLLQLELQSNPVIMNFARTQQTATNYLREINVEVSHVLGLDFGQMAKPPSSCC